MTTLEAMLQRPGARTDHGSRWAALLAGGLLLLVGASRAEAAGISIVNVSSTGSSTSELSVGDILTVELVANNDTHLDIYGFGLIAWGYDVDSNGVADDGLRMLSVESAVSFFNTTVTSSGAVFGGLPDIYSLFPDDPARPREYQIASLHTGLQTQLVNAVSLTPANGDGGLDIGLGGASIADGDVHFRIAFQATSQLDATEITLNFGVGDPTATGVAPTRAQVIVGEVLAEGGRALLPFENSTLRVAILGDPDYNPPSGSGGGDSTGGTGGGSTGGTGGSTGGGTGSTGGGGVVGAVPEPGAALLFAAGLVTLGLVGRR